MNSKMRKNEIGNDLWKIIPKEAAINVAQVFNP